MNAPSGRATQARAVAVPGRDGPVGEVSPGRPARGWPLGEPQIKATSALMAQAPSMPRERTGLDSIRRIRPNRRGLRENGEAVRSGRWPLVAFARDPDPAPAFRAVEPNEDVAVRADTGGVVPPDTMGDVGPAQYLLAINGRVRTIRKNDGRADGVLDVDSDAFFGAAADGKRTGDPRVRYDRRARRWIVLMFNVDVPNRYLLAVSDAAIITAGTNWRIWYWRNTRTVAGQGCLGDYPTLGVDEDALYVGVNQFCGANTAALQYDSSTAYVLPRAPLMANGDREPRPVVFQFDELQLRGGAGPFSPHGVDNYDSDTDEGYFIGVDGAVSSLLVLRRVSNPGIAPAISADMHFTVPATRAWPNLVPQPSGRGLDALDDRLLSAVIRGGRLWTLHNVTVNRDGVGESFGGRTAQRWYEIGNLETRPVAIQAGTIFDSGVTGMPVHHWMGSLMVNGQGHVAMGLSTGGASEYVNAEYTGRLADDPPGQMRQPRIYSANHSTVYAVQETSRQRWGDYSSTSVDPNDDMTMWTLQQYPDGPSSYAVRLVRLLAPPPPRIVEVSPPAVPAGARGLVVIVTGEPESGGGFFDPAPNVDNRLSAAFDGGSVEVSDVRVLSPTTLMLTIDTTASVPGVRTLSVTNPDGQKATRAGALTVVAEGETLPPSGLRVVRQTGDSVTLAWELPEARADFTGLQLEGGYTPGDTIGAIPLAPTTSATVRLPRGRLFLRLRLSTSRGRSVVSNEIPVQVVQALAPSAPVNLLGLAYGNALQLAWTPTYQQGEPTGHLLEVTGDASLALPLGGGDTFAHVGVPQGTYTFAVRQLNATGVSAPSNSVTLRFPGQCALPQHPEHFVVSTSPGYVSLLWDPPSAGPAPTAYVLRASGAYVGGISVVMRSLAGPVPPGTYQVSVAAATPCGVGPALPAKTVTVP